MINKFLLSVLLYSLIFVSCKKDTKINNECETPKTIVQEIEPCNMPDSMRNLPYCNSPIGIQWITHYPSFGLPFFNPNNANELVFYENSPTATNLVILNLNTKITFTLTNQVNGVDGHPYWSKDGYIYYNGNDQYIHKVDPITNIVSNTNFIIAYVNPIVNYGNYFTLGGTINWPRVYYKNNNFGQRIDSVYSDINSAADLSSNGLFAYTDTFSTGWDISIANFSNNTKTITRLTNFMDLSQNTFITDIKWHPNGQDLFFVKRNQELYKMNIITKKLTLIKRTGRAILFDSFTISPDGNKIVISNTIYNIDYSQTNPNPCQLITSNYFTIMDLNGCNEQLLYKE